MFRPTRSEGKVKQSRCSVNLLVSSCCPALDFPGKVNFFILTQLFLYTYHLYSFGLLEKCEFPPTFLSLKTEGKINLPQFYSPVFFLKDSCKSSVHPTVSSLVLRCEWTHQPSSITEVFQINSFTYICPILNCAHPESPGYLLTTFLDFHPHSCITLTLHKSSIKRCIGEPTSNNRWQYKTILLFHLDPKK